jgi:hypothetical protein
VALGSLFEFLPETPFLFESESLRFEPLLFNLEELALGEMQIAYGGLRLLGCLKEVAVPFFEGTYKRVV